MASSWGRQTHISQDVSFNWYSLYLPVIMPQFSDVLLTLELSSIPITVGLDFWVFRLSYQMFRFMPANFISLLENTRPWQKWSGWARRPIFRLYGWFGQLEQILDIIHSGFPLYSKLMIDDYWLVIEYWLEINYIDDVDAIQACVLDNYYHRDHPG